MVGYSLRFKRYCLFDSVTNKTVVRRDVVFNETEVGLSKPMSNDDKIVSVDVSETT